MSSRNQEIAKTILMQMGGSNRLNAMIGAKYFAAIENGLSFRFKMSKAANYVKITLNSLDLYDIEFGKVWGKNFKIVKTVNDVYDDQLKSIFERTTGLYLSL